MKCPFCNYDLELYHRESNVDDQYTLCCKNCGAIGSIFRRKRG